MNFVEFLVEWVARDSLLRNTDPGRTIRGMKIRQVRNQIFEIEGKKMKLDKIEFSTRSIEHTEPDVDQPHKGYVLYDPKNLKIYQVYCDCLDFYTRLYAPFVKKGLATFNLEPKYAQDAARRSAEIKTHNRQWTKITNPMGKLFLCKHLYTIAKNYLAQDNAPTITINPKKPVEVPKQNKNIVRRTEPTRPKTPRKP